MACHFHIRLPPRISLRTQTNFRLLCHAGVTQKLEIRLCSKAIRDTRVCLALRARLALALARLKNANKKKNACSALFYVSRLRRDPNQLHWLSTYKGKALETRLPRYSVDVLIDIPRCVSRLVSKETAVLRRRWGAGTNVWFGTVKS